MKFEVSETVSSADQTAILNCLEAQFKKVAESVYRGPNYIKVSSIEASFGSINRSDETVVSIKPARNGLMLVAEVNYRPSVAFWFIVILTLFTWVFWLIPIVFYLMQKNTVKEGIVQVFKRAKDEFEQGGLITAVAAGDNLYQLQKYAALKAQGFLTEEEFSKKKKELLGL